MRKIVRISDITLNPDLQVRVETSEETVRAYAEMIRNGTMFDPVQLYDIGTDDQHEYVVVDGWHRIEATVEARNNGRDTYIDADVTTGTYDEALLVAASANARHGKNLTAEDRKKAVLMLYQNFPNMPQTEIGERVGISQERVGQIIREFSSTTSHLDDEATDAGESESGLAETVPDFLPKAIEIALDALTGKEKRIRISDIGKKCKVSRGLPKLMGIAPKTIDGYLVITSEFTEKLLARYKEITGEDYQTVKERRAIKALQDKDYARRKADLAEIEKANKETLRKGRAALDADRQKLAKEKETLMDEALKDAKVEMARIQADTTATKDQKESLEKAVRLQESALKKATADREAAEKIAQDAKDAAEKEKAASDAKVAKIKESAYKALQDKERDAERTARDIARVLPILRGAIWDAANDLSKDHPASSRYYIISMALAKIAGFTSGELDALIDAKRPEPASDLPDYDMTDPEFKGKFDSTRAYVRKMFLKCNNDHAAIGSAIVVLAIEKEFAALKAGLMADAKKIR